MSVDGDLNDLIGRIYDAVLGGEDWAAVLERITALLGADAAALHPTGIPVPCAAAVRVGCDPAYVPLYNAHYHLLWPMMDMMRRLPPGSVFFDRMLVPEATFFRTEFYNDYAKPQGRHSALYWVDTDEGGLAAHLSLWRTRQRPAWGLEEIRLLRRLGPHLDRALTIERRLRTAAGKRAAGQLSGARPPLTRRELQCLGQLAHGGSAKSVARRLDLSTHTVESYVKSAIRKLRAGSRSEAVAMALSLDLIDGLPPEPTSLSSIPQSSGVEAPLSPEHLYQQAIVAGRTTPHEPPTPERTDRPSPQ